jgi:hypothetical protein
MITAVPQIKVKSEQGEGNEQVSRAEKGSTLYKSNNSKEYQTDYSYNCKNIYEKYFASGLTVMGFTHTAENNFLAISQQQHKKIIHTMHQSQEQPILG